MSWSAHYATPAGYRHWPNEELVRSMSGKPPDGRILEVGCGNGANLPLLLEYARRLDAVDAYAPILPEAAELVGRRCSPTLGERLHLWDASAHDLPFDDGTFDGVVDCMTSQHVTWADHKAVYTEYSRVLKPGGWLFLLHLNSDTYSDDAAREAATYDYPRGIRLFKDAGFVCLPSWWSLETLVRECRFYDAVTRKSTRETCAKPGSRASYAIIDARRV